MRNGKTTVLLYETSKKIVELDVEFSFYYRTGGCHRDKLGNFIYEWLDWDEIIIDQVFIDADSDHFPLREIDVEKLNKRTIDFIISEIEKESCEDFIND